MTYFAVSADASATTPGSGPAASAIDLLNAPLWRDVPEPEGLQQGRKNLIAFFEADDQTWTFWKRWYLAMHDGTWRDWDLARDIALIPDDVWEQGAAAVAEEIRKLEAAHILKRLPQAETLVFDEHSRIGFAPVAMQKPDLMSVLLDRVGDLVEDVQMNPSNGLNERSVEIRTLARTISRYGNNPQRIEMDFVQVHAGLARQIATQDLPPSEENTTLRDALEEGARAIRATHPDVAENRAILQGAAFQEISEEDMALLDTAAPVLEAISDDATAEEWREDLRPFERPEMLPPDH